MLDNAVTLFGTLVENMLQERDEIGSGNAKQWVNRYSIRQLLDADFVFPKPPDDQRRNEEGWDLTGIAGVEGLAFDEVK